jgi:hypothetical protein
MTDQPKISLPVTASDWTETSLMASVDDISHYYDQLGYDIIDDWLLENFDVLISNQIIRIISINTLGKPLSALKSYESLMVDNITDDDRIFTMHSLYHHVRINVRYLINITGDSVTVDEDWHVDTSDILEYARKKNLDARNFMATKILPVINGLLKTTPYLIKKIPKAMPSGMEQKHLLTFEYKTE